MLFASECLSPVMMYKNRQWVDSPWTLRWVLEEQEAKNLSVSTIAVPAKNSPKGQVSEWEISKNSMVRELGIFCVPRRRGDLMLI